MPENVAVYCSQSLINNIILINIYRQWVGPRVSEKIDYKFVIQVYDR